MSTENRLSELLRTHTPDPPPEIDPATMAARARERRPISRRRTLIVPLIAAAAVIAVVVAGYAIRRATDTGAAPAAPPTTGGPPSIAGSVPPGVHDRPTSAQIEWATELVNAWNKPGPTPQLIDYSPVGVTVRKIEVSPDGRTLTGTFVGAVGPASTQCGDDYFGYAVQNDAVVAFVVTSVKNPAGPGPLLCGGTSTDRTASVTLDEPLNGRAVIEAGHGKTVPVTRR